MPVVRVAQKVAGAEVVVAVGDVVAVVVEVVVVVGDVEQKKVGVGLAV